MNRFKRMRPLPLIVGGLITMGLAIWLLPKPTTDADPVSTEPPPVPTASAPPSAVPQPIVGSTRPVPSTPTAPVPQTAVASTGPVMPSAPDAGPYAMTSRGFQAAMRYRHDAIIACYDQWARDQPDLPPRQVVRFYLSGGEETSLVDRVEVMDSPANNAPMQECVLGVMADAEFEASDVDRAYTFPFNFGERPDK